MSAEAAKVALYRLSRQGLVSSPARGYYVVVPPEYPALGCLPAEQLVPSLMERLATVGVAAADIADERRRMS